MPDDLKSMLKVVEQNLGHKKFFFGYALGKRADGNGDGHLIVGRTKPKRPQFVDECACTAFFDGRCWSSKDGEVIYFTSKKTLGPTLIAKMALTAKRMTGKTVYFELPSPEEEERGTKLPSTWPPWPGGD